MDKTEILVIGKDPEILQTVIRLINQHEGWHGTGVSKEEDAIEKFHQQAFAILLLTNGIAEEEERRLRRIFHHQYPEALIIQHYGGGSGLLSNEILGALEQKRLADARSITVHDGIFKNS